jgi:hypothetical protein
MAKSRTIRVTPNVLNCLVELKKAVKAMPAGELKKRANAALAYLDRTFQGERQPRAGAECTEHTLIIK